jgi:FixJ family two-component response regulator
MNLLRRVNQGLSGLRLPDGAVWRRFSSTLIDATAAFIVWQRGTARLERAAGGRMAKRSLVSIVEDDQFFRESMTRLMRSLGHRVEAFASATDFLASPRLGETACLIADVNMPVMTGIELYRHLKQSGDAIPTILVTAYGDDYVEARALRDGVICYLRKPIDEQQLKQCLVAALERRADDQ